MVTVSTATGYILAKGSLSFSMFIPMIGIFILALGSGALNQYQERRKDALMPRTRNRPIPSNRISPGMALLFSMFLMFAGSLVLYFGTNLTALILGLLTAVWYNGVYTYLKRVTPLAVIPGSIIGALPPLVGWASAGGDVLAPQALALAIFFFIWQIPHFWLLLLNFGKDYECAGFPTLTAMMNREQLARLTYIGIVVTAAGIMFLPMFGMGRSLLAVLLLFLSAIWLVWNSSTLLKPAHRDFSFRLAFRGINIFILSVMVLLSLDRLIHFG